MTALSTLRRLLGEATPGPWRAEFSDYRDGCDLRARFMRLDAASNRFPFPCSAVALPATPELKE